MLSIFDSCSLGRRDFLRIGTLGLGGRRSLAARARAAERAQGGQVGHLPVPARRAEPDRDVRPQDDAPRRRSAAPPARSRTALPGVTFGATFPKLAQLADKLTDRPLVRHRRRQPRHQAGRRPATARRQPGLRLRARRRREPSATGMPTNAVLFPQAVDADTAAGQRASGNLTPPGRLGSVRPVRPRRRRQLAAEHAADACRATASTTAARCCRGLRRPQGVTRPAAGQRIDQLQRAGVRSVLLGGVGEAFDLSRETARASPATTPRRSSQPDSIEQASGTTTTTTSITPASLGKLLLLARRLCEAGCGFVTVTTNFVWDMHADVNNAPVDEGMQLHGPAARSRRRRRSSRTWRRAA